MYVRTYSTGHRANYKRQSDIRSTLVSVRSSFALCKVSSHRYNVSVQQQIAVLYTYMYMYVCTYVPESELTAGHWPFNFHTLL